MTRVTRLGLCALALLVVASTPATAKVKDVGLIELGLHSAVVTTVLDIEAAVPVLELSVKETVALSGSTESVFETLTPTKVGKILEKDALNRQRHRKMLAESSYLFEPNHGGVHLSGLERTGRFLIESTYRGGSRRDVCPYASGFLPHLA